MIKDIYDLLKDDLDKIVTDTRILKPGDIFLTLKGERFNGNDFVDQALEKNVKFVIADEISSVDSRVLSVPNAYQCLVELAKHHREVLQTFIIAITGTNGKTTSKELIKNIFQKKYNTIATEGNLNNHIGVPLTLLKLKPEHEFLILEMGANKKGDIAELCEISDPDVGLITNIGKAHLEGFGNESGVLETKTELFNYLNKENKLVFLNYNSPAIFKIRAMYPNSISYGTDHQDAEYTYELLSAIPSIQLIDHSTLFKQHFTSNLFGDHNFENLMLAITVAHHFEIPNERIQSGIDAYVPNNMRSQVMKYRNNTIVLDAYNANPSSMLMAIKSIEQYPHSFKWIILGSMAELGKFSIEEHTGIIEYINSFQFEKIILVGKEFQITNLKVNTLWFENTEECKIWLEQNFPSGKLILIKGSRSIGLEKLVIN
ncbi:MAG: UDP-N-acetylmuramoyl-tripeptide--D-alanyl-D-alanine ligase [Saprospiraceae bacterium]